MVPLPLQQTNWWGRGKVERHFRNKQIRSLNVTVDNVTSDSDKCIAWVGHMKFKTAKKQQFFSAFPGWEGVRVGAADSPSSPPIQFKKVRIEMIRMTVCLLILFFAGCEAGDLVDHSRDPDMFVVTVKEMVLQSAEDARESDEPADALWAVVQDLDPDELRHRPTGEYTSIYEQLHSMASEISAACEAVDGRTPDLNQRLDELVALTNQLPGDVTPESRDID